MSEVAETGGDQGFGSTIGESETEAWIADVARPLLEAGGDAATERRILAEAVVRWGVRLAPFFDLMVEMGGGDPRFARWKDAAHELFVEFAQGGRITDRVDEDERRAVLARERFDDPSLATLFRRMLAEHLLGLPPGHPQRDVERATRALEQAISEYRTAGDQDGELAALAVLIEHALVADRELESAIGRGEELLTIEPGAHYRRRFLLAVAELAADRAIAARDRDDSDERQRWAERHLHVIERLRSAEPDDMSIELQLGLSYELLGRLDEAAMAFETAAAGLDARGRLLALENAGRLRASIGDWPGAVGALRPLLDDLAAGAVTELHWEGEVDRGSFARLGRQLVRAHAELGEWDEAVDALDRLKSLRFRARRSWRDSASGHELLDLERWLWADQRGVPVSAPERPFDFLGDVAPRTALLEAYRQLRPLLDESDLATPSPPAVAAVLEPGEIVVTLGLLDGGTVAAALTADGPPGWSGRLDESWPVRRWLDLFAGSEDGFAYVLGAPEADLDGPRSLSRLLAELDGLFAGVIGELIPEEAERVTIVAHGLLHLAPLWAVPCLEDRRVRTSPSLAQLVAARRGPVRTLAGRAVICADPTGDLPGTSLEAAVVGQHLERLQLVTDVLPGSAATEDRVGATVAGAALFHFAGHGVGDVIDPTQAALLMAPDPEMTLAGDPFPALVDVVETWQPSATDPEARFVSTSAGRLTERSLLDGRWIERWLEAGPTTTLWAHYIDGRLETLAERWSAGDLLIDDRFAGCRVAVLSACSSAVGSLGLEIDEASGLPAAFEMTGVDVVVATTWPVADPLALIFTDLFYGALAAARGSVHIADLVDDMRHALRTMPLAEALNRLDGLRRRTSDALVRLSLEAYARDLRTGARPDPFGDPWDWAAFGVFGGSVIEVGGSS